MKREFRFNQSINVSQQNTNFQSIFSSIAVSPRQVLNDSLEDHYQTNSIYGQPRSFKNLNSAFKITSYDPFSNFKSVALHPSSNIDESEIQETQVYHTNRPLGPLKMNGCMIGNARGESRYASVEHFNRTIR